MADWLTWQIVDSAFPTGLFAHSWGLEAAWQQGELESVEAVQEFVEACALQTAFGVLPFLNTAFASPDRLESLDPIADAFLTNPVANRASRIQGRTLIATAARVWSSAGLNDLAVRAGKTHAHVAPLSGAVFRALGISLADAQRVSLYSAARGVLSAATRLGIIGGFEAQRLQHASAPWLERVARQSASLSLDDLAQTAPVLDLLHANHDRLYSRLYQS